MSRPRSAPVRLQYNSDVPSRALAVFVKHFQWKLMSQLKAKKRSRAESGKILIPASLFEHFKATYHVSGAFKTNVALMDSLSLINIRYINNTDYCSFNKNLIRVRVGRTRKVQFKDCSMQNIDLYSGHYLFSYRFIRYEGKNN